MTSQLPPSAVPGPGGTPEWEQPEGDDQQPDPFSGTETDAEGKPTGEDAANAGGKDDPRAQ